MRTGREGERGADEGSVLPLVLVLFLIAAVFVAVAAGATALHLERLRLLTVADGAALAAAESFRVADARVEGDAVVPRLESSRVAAAAADYVGGADVPDLEGLRIVAADTADGRTARVVLRGRWRPPIAAALLPSAVEVTVASTAAARFR